MITERPLLEQIKLACKKTLVFVIIFSFFINLFMLTVPIYMLQVFDRVLASQSTDTLLFLTIIAIFLLSIMGALSIIRSQILIRVSRWLDNRLSPEALLRGADEILQGRPYATQSLKDISTIRQTVSGPALLTLLDSPWVPIYLAVIFALHPILGVIATIGAIVLFALATLNEVATKNLLFRANLNLQKNSYKVNVSLRNSETIQAMGMLPEIIKHWFSENEKILSDQELASKRASTILAISRFFRLVLQILMLGAGAYLVVQNQLTPGMMIAGTILLARALAPVEQAIGAWSQLTSARKAYESVKAYLTQAQTRTAQMKLPKPTGKLSVETMSYTPPNTMKPVLKKINFTINPGENLTIIGPSAAGKTTLARLIIGAYQPSKGHVRLDGADVYTWDRSNFGEHVGYLPQSVELFPGTVKENISRLREADAEAVTKAAQLAEVHKMILKLPDGYDTNLADTGINLSGGQRQRIALARALFGDPQLIVLDEPNASLDTAGELALTKALKALKERGATVITISHRSNILKATDKLLFLMNGELKMFGPRDAVLAKLKEMNQQA